MAITPLPTPPEVTDTPQEFNTKAFAWVDALDTFVTEANAQATDVNNNAQLAEDWASKTNGEVDSTDYSAKAWAVGGTGVTDTASRGAAKEWATETASTVDGTEYSSKEYAVGTQTRGTTGSAKDWSTYTSGTVDSTEYSAKEYAVGTQTRGTTGSAKDWATYTSGTVDGSGYSAKYHADAASGSASAAAASAAAAVQTADVTEWSSGATYAAGDNVYSPSDFKTYRNKTGTNTSTDPSLDDTNWEPLTFSLPNQSGQNGKFLTTDGSDVSWGTVDTSAAGNDTEIQYNDGGARAGASGLTTDGSNLTINTQNELRFGDSDDSNYVGFKAPATIAADKIWTLPDADGTNGQSLVTNGSGVLSWASGSTPGPFADGSAGSPSITFASDTNTGAFRPTTDTFSITTNGTERIRVGATGIVGINQTTPRGQLHVRHSNNDPQNLDRDNASTDGGLVLENSYSGNRVMIRAVDGQAGAGASSGEMRFYTTPYDGGYIYKEAMALKIDGKVFLSGQTTGIQPNGSNELNIYANNGIKTIFRSDRVELRPTSGQDAILHLGNGYNNYKSAIIARDISNYGRQYVYFVSRNNSDGNPLDISTNTFFKFQEGSVYFPLVGTTGSGANAFLNSGAENQLLRSTSSLQYKTDVEDLDATYSQKIYDLRPIWYRSLADADRKDWSWFGFGAEEVAEIEPRLVHYTYDEDQWETITTPDPTDEYPDQVRTERVLKEGAVAKPDGVMYDRLTVLLVKEMQALKAKCDALEARLSELEGS